VSLLRRFGINDIRAEEISLIDVSSSLAPRLRWTILALLSSSIAINLIDRQVLSVLAPVLREEMHLSATQYAYITASFQLGMMAGQVPIGALLDRVGTRFGLAAIFIAWSVVGGAHALASGLGGFVALRFLMGLSECGNYTAGIKAIAGMFPSATRASAGGLFNAGAQLGSLVATPLVVFIASTLGWRMAFLVPCVVGLLWLVPWLTLFPPSPLRGYGPSASSGPSRAPSRDGATSPSPLRGEGGVSLATLLRNRKVLGLFLIRVFSGPITTLYWAWLPLYLRTGREMSFGMIGVLGWLPSLFGMTGNVVGGMLTDRLVRVTGSVDRGRKLAFAGAFGLSALSMAMPFVANDYAALALMGLALFGNQWVAATYIGTVGDVVPQQLAGRVNGIAGFGDSSSVLVAQLVIGVLVDRYSFTPVFVGAGLFPVLAFLSVVFVLGRIERAQFHTPATASHATRQA
jgi:MFS transporter, ACS family, hexuronate transporter